MHEMSLLPGIIRIRAKHGLMVDCNKKQVHDAFCGEHTQLRRSA